MAYIFNAMTHLAIDIRLKAFEFLDLVLEFFPSSLSSYAEKVESSVHVVFFYKRYIVLFFNFWEKGM